jgi:hypothetical protein
MRPSPGQRRRARRNDLFKEREVRLAIKSALEGVNAKAKADTIFDIVKAQRDD